MPSSAATGLNSPTPLPMLGRPTRFLPEQDLSFERLPRLTVSQSTGPTRLLINSVKLSSMSHPPNRTMKKISILFSLLLGIASLAQATIVINMNGVTLYGNDTSSVLPLGTLVQVIVDTGNNGFSTPTVGSLPEVRPMTWCSRASLTTTSMARVVCAGDTICSSSNGIATGAAIALALVAHSNARVFGTEQDEHFGQFRTNIVQRSFRYRLVSPE